jgi:two-component system nitrate/nitrite response regulator NarL
MRPPVRALLQSRPGAVAMNSNLHLTPREREVVREIVAGRRNREIARELGLTEQAIKNVLSVVYQKCQVRTRLELAIFALRHHLLSF